MEKKKVSTIILNIVFALAMVAVLLFHILPFWSVGEYTASLLDVAARQYKDFGGSGYLIEALDIIVDGFSYKDINVQVLLSIVFSGIAVLLALTSKNGWLKVICAVLCLAFGLWLYIAVPAFSLGVMCYVILACEIAGVLLSVLVLMDYMKNKQSKK